MVTYSVYVDNQAVAKGFTTQAQAYAKCEELRDSGISTSRICWRPDPGKRDTMGDMLTSCGY